MARQMSFRGVGGGFTQVGFAALVAVALGGPVAAQATVTYTQQTGLYSASFFDGGGWYNPNGTQVGMWANINATAKEAVAWRNFLTAGDNTGSARDLQVGDRFTITVQASSAFGGIGFSLNDGGTQGSSYANRVSGSRLYVQEIGTTGSWEVNRSGGFTSLNYNVGTTTRDYTFEVTMTSESSANVQMVVNGSVVDNRAYNLALNGTAGANIDAYSIWLKDNWNGSANADIFWEQETSVESTGAVELGYFLASPNTFTPGRVTDGLAANSTTTAQANAVFIGGDAGSQVNLNQNNTYTGATTINANATGEAQHANALGSTAAGTTVSNAGTLKLYSPTGISFASESLTLNGLGVSGTNGALRQVGGTNTWNGAVTLGSSSRINADASGGAGSLTIAGNVSGGANVLFLGANGSPITISGAISGAGTAQDGTTTSVFKDGASLLTFSGNNIYTGDTRVTSGTLSVAAGGNLGNGSDVFLSTGAVLNIATSVTVASLQETGVGNAGTAIIGSGAVLTINGNGFNVFQDSISGGGGLSIAGSGTTNLFDPQTYTGTTSVSAGRLATSGSMSTSSVEVSGGTFATGSANLLPDVVPVVLSGAGVFGIGGNETIGSLAGTGGTAALGSNNLTLAGNDTKTFAGAITGSGTFAKNGSGELTLSGNSGSFTGVMDVLAGSLLVTGTHAMNQLNVGSGATLGGTGDIGYAAATSLSFASGATLAPGNSVGSLDGNFDNATLTGGMTYVFEVNDANGTAGGPNGWDIFTNVGDVTLAASGSNQITLDIASLNGSSSGAAANFNPNFNYAWRFVAAGTPISPFNAGWFNVDSTGFSNGTSGGSFYVARGDQMSNIGAAGTNAELYVVFAAVPEPSSYALAGCGLAAWAVLWRRQRRSTR